MPTLKTASEKIMQRAKISKENRGGQTEGLSDKIAIGEIFTNNIIIADRFGLDRLTKKRMTRNKTKALPPNKPIKHLTSISTSG
jgi:hypothetical protein